MANWFDLLMQQQLAAKEMPPIPVAPGKGPESSVKNLGSEIIRDAQQEPWLIRQGRMEQMPTPPAMDKVRAQSAAAKQALQQMVAAPKEGEINPGSPLSLPPPEAKFTPSAAAQPGMSRGGSSPAPTPPQPKSTPTPQPTPASTPGAASVTRIAPEVSKETAKAKVPPNPFPTPGVNKGMAAKPLPGKQQPKPSAKKPLIPEKTKIKHNGQEVRPGQVIDEGQGDTTVYGLPHNGGGGAPQTTEFSDREPINADIYGSGGMDKSPVFPPTPPPIEDGRFDQPAYQPIEEQSVNDMMREALPPPPPPPARKQYTIPPQIEEGQRRMNDHFRPQSYNDMQDVEMIDHLANITAAGANALGSVAYFDPTNSRNIAYKGANIHRDGYDRALAFEEELRKREKHDYDNTQRNFNLEKLKNEGYQLEDEREMLLQPVDPSLTNYLRGMGYTDIPDNINYSQLLAHQGISGNMKKQVMDFALKRDQILADIIKAKGGAGGAGGSKSPFQQAKLDADGRVYAGSFNKDTGAYEFHDAGASSSALGQKTARDIAGSRLEHDANKFNKTAEAKGRVFEIKSREDAKAVEVADLPGGKVGFAYTPKDAQDLKTINLSTQMAKDYIRRMNDIYQKSGGRAALKDPASTYGAMFRELAGNLASELAVLKRQGVLQPSEMTGNLALLGSTSLEGKEQWVKNLLNENPEAVLYGVAQSFDKALNAGMKMKLRPRNQFSLGGDAIARGNPNYIGGDQVETYEPQVQDIKAPEGPIQQFTSGVAGAVDRLINGKSHIRPQETPQPNATPIPVPATERVKDSILRNRQMKKGAQQ